MIGVGTKTFKVVSVKTMTGYFAIIKCNFRCHIKRMPRMVFSLVSVEKEMIKLTWSFRSIRTWERGLRLFVMVTCRNLHSYGRWGFRVADKHHSQVEKCTVSFLLHDVLQSYNKYISACYSSSSSVMKEG